MNRDKKIDQNTERWIWIGGCMNCSGRFECEEAFTAKATLCAHYSEWEVHTSGWNEQETKPIDIKS